MSGLAPRARTTLIILLAGCAVGLLTTPRRLADASTYVLMVDSLWADGDLTYAPDDLARAQALSFGDLPGGLFLTKHRWGYGYGKPLLYPSVALPFYALLGVRGFYALNGVLLAALVLLGADILSHRLPWRRAQPAAAVVFGFSVTPAYLHWIDPFLLCSVLVAGAVAAYRRARPATTAALLVALASCRPAYLALGLAPAALYLIAAQWRRLARYAAAAVVVGALLLGLGRFANGQWSPYGGERYFYNTAFPYQRGADEPEIGGPAEIDLDRAGWLHLGEIARSNLYFFLGRFAGVLVYFPTLLACALWSRSWDREKLIWLAALLATCQALQLSLPHNIFGGNHTLGNRLFVLLPVALLCVDFLAWHPGRALATAVLMLLAVPIVQAPLYLSIYPGRQIAELPYRLLPFEWTQALRVAYPAEYPPGMMALTWNQYAWEGQGVWTRGATTAEFVLVRGLDDAPRVHLSTFLPSARISDGDVPLTLQWEPGREQEITLAHPVVTFAEERNQGRELAVYRLRITTDSGTPVAVIGDRHDNRYVGVFVRPTASVRLR